MQSMAQEMLDSPLFRVFKDLARLKGEPRVLVVITHAFLELTVNLIIEAKCKEGKKIIDSHRDFPHSVKLTILYETGVLSDHHYRLLNWFRKLRNDAAHQPFFKLTPKDLAIFVMPEHRNPDKFHSLCGKVLLDMLGSYGAIIGPYVLPVAYITTEKRVLMVEEPAQQEAIPLTNDPKTVKRRV